MTVTELIDYLMRYADHGKGNAVVVVANKSWNPIEDGDSIANAVFIESRDGECQIVLQTD